MNDTTNDSNNLVAGKSNTFQDAFWKSIVGKTAVIVVNQLEEDEYKIHQVDQYNVIAETMDGEFVLLAKGSIIAVFAPDTAIPELLTNIAAGVNKIKYKASEERTGKNKGKFDKRPKPTEQRGYTGPAVPYRQVEVITKPRRILDKTG